ncbi:dihydroxyacid dehydratase [Fusarium circinatum]|uniref:Dihydroxyacid dehydratase n=1 Tax=Fusarium circinatum TaxID=48490 RepID=A0A8H6CUA1_FUSCI|nr:dihydroxyacid dehydratase [Fusarium circinatum]
MNDQPQVHDLMIVLDAISGNISQFTTLRTAIQDIVDFMVLAGCFERIGVIAYRNYTTSAVGRVIKWSGWCHPSSETSRPSSNDLIKFLKDLELPDGTEDNSYCASKMALAMACQQMRTNGTIILLYNHAPPMFGHINEDYHPYKLEQLALGGFGPIGRLFKQWIKGASVFAGTSVLAGANSVSKKAVVLSFSLSADVSDDSSTNDIREWSPYLYLSAATGGDLYRTTYERRVITRLTIGLLLSWMGTDGNIGIPESFRIAYKKTPMELFPQTEENLEKFCGTNCRNLESLNTLTTPRNCLFRVPYGGISNNYQEISILTSRHVARKYITGSEDYKNVISKRIRGIMRRNASVMTIQPLFGRLWVAVCQDPTRENANMVGKLRTQIKRIGSSGDRRQILTWLEESYTFFHEIKEDIQKQEEANQEEVYQEEVGQEEVYQEEADQVEDNSVSGLTTD